MAISSVSSSSNTISVSTSLAPVEYDLQSSATTLKIKENSAIAQLSALGQVKASLTELQSKAEALKNFSKPPTFADFQLVVQGFVQSFNSLNKNISQMTSRQGQLSADSPSGQALSSVSQAIAGTNENGLSALQKIGLSQQAEGTFSINQNQLGKSFQDNRPGALSTIFDLANRVTQATDKQISTNGFIGGKVNDLSVRTSELGNTRGTAQGYLGAQNNSPQFVAVQPHSTGGYAARNAVATYSSVASL